MDSLRKDTKGQWIALSGLVISLIVIGLAALANQSMVAGYYSSNAVLEFPKENIRELNSHTRDNAMIIRGLSLELNSTSNNSVPVIYEQLFADYSSQIETLYAMHGETVDVSLVSLNTSSGTYNSSDIDIVFVNITYNDGDTYYVSQPEIIEVRK